MSLTVWGLAPDPALAQGHDGHPSGGHPSEGHYSGNYGHYSGHYYGHPYAYNRGYYYHPNGGYGYHYPYRYYSYYRPYRYYSYYYPYYWGYPYYRSNYYYPYYGYYDYYPYAYDDAYSYPYGGDSYVPPSTYSPSYGSSETAAWRVGIRDNYFEPKTLEVPVGTTVTWTNYGEHRHTVTSYRGLFDSGELDYGGTFSRTFSEPGSYYYDCTLHPNEMWGTIIVR
jgi:plastocyanin